MVSFPAFSSRSLTDRLVDEPNTTNASQARERSNDSTIVTDFAGSSKSYSLCGFAFQEPTTVEAKEKIDHMTSLGSHVEPFILYNVCRKLIAGRSADKSALGLAVISQTVVSAFIKSPSVYFQVTWSPRKGEIKNRQWSVKKYGEEEAFRLAKEFRAKVMFDIYGDRYEEMIKEQAAIDSGYEPD
jgi:hypothetical protein